MRLSIPLLEIEEYIRTSYNVSVKIGIVDGNKIEVDYLFKILIIVKEVKDYSILLGYELNWVANTLAKSAKFMTKDSLDEKILQWNTSKKEVLINLIHVSALDGFLRVFKISEFRIEDNELKIGLSK